MKIMRYLLVFLTGGIAYVGLELLWRGRSHGSMFLAGGVCLLLIGHLEEVEPKLNLPLRTITGAGIITMVELGIGLLVNREYSVWDYRMLPGNWLGQISPAYCLAWIPVSGLAGWLYRRLDTWLPVGCEGR